MRIGGVNSGSLPKTCTELAAQGRRRSRPWSPQRFEFVQ